MPTDAESTCAVAKGALIAVFAEIVSTYCVPVTFSVPVRVIVPAVNEVPAVIEVPEPIVVFDTNAAAIAVPLTFNAAVLTKLLAVKSFTIVPALVFKFSVVIKLLAVKLLK